LFNKLDSILGVDFAFDDYIKEVSYFNINMIREHPYAKSHFTGAEDLKLVHQ
jgi:hypothetical protein